MAICGSSLGALATFCNLPPKVSVDGSSTTRWIPAADFATKWKWQPAPCQPTLLKAHRGIKQATRRSCDCLMCPVRHIAAHRRFHSLGMCDCGFVRTREATAHGSNQQTPWGFQKRRRIYRKNDTSAPLYSEGKGRKR